MRNVLRMLWRDTKRLLKTPAATIVVLFLIVLPSLYTWYNVVGFWDPYGNTGNMHVCVVNMDEGGSSELTGQLNVGDTIVEALKENDQLDWEITGYDIAMSELASGNSYAVYVIPYDFTRKLLTITSGNFEQPNILYYVNEKTGPAAPKITDTGSTTLDETINSTFVSTVSDTAAKVLDVNLKNAQADISNANSEALQDLNGALNSISNARGALFTVQLNLASARNSVNDARSGLDQANKDIDAASAALSDVSTLTQEMQKDLDDTTAAVSPIIGNLSTQLSNAYSEAQKAASGISSAAEQAKGAVDTAAAEAQQVVNQANDTIAYLELIRDMLPQDSYAYARLTSSIEQLQAMVQGAQRTLDDLPQLESDVDNLASGAQDALKSMDDTIGTANTAFNQYTSMLFGTTFPTVSANLGKLAVATANLSAAIQSQHMLVSQTSSVIDQLDGTIVSAQDAITQTDGILATVQDGVTSVRNDLLSLREANAQLSGTNMNASDFMDFMGSSAQLTTEELYPIVSYGAAMGPLFMNLTCWIGAFMLLVIMKQEVDDEGIENLTLTQRYIGRYLLFAIIAVLQAVVCCAGLMYLNIQPVNVPAFFFASAVASLAYLSIIYMLSVTLQHVGKGLCILLVFAQIPGATGLYPVEMTSVFFQATYPFLPFTYGIGAMREAMCGFYGNQYVVDIAVLFLFLFLFMVLGIFLRPLLANLNRMTAQQVEESEILNGETVDIPVRQFRFVQIAHALLDKEDYREALIARYEKFMKRRPMYLRLTIIIGVVTPIAFTVLFSMGNTTKVVLLTAWMIWLVIVFLVLIFLENFRFSLSRQLNMKDMSDEELINASKESRTEGGHHDA